MPSKNIKLTKASLYLKVFIQQWGLSDTKGWFLLKIIKGLAPKVCKPQLTGASLCFPRLCCPLSEVKNVTGNRIFWTKVFTEQQFYALIRWWNRILSHLVNEDQRIICLKICLFAWLLRSSCTTPSSNHLSEIIQAAVVIHWVHLHMYRERQTVLGAWGWVVCPSHVIMLFTDHRGRRVNRRLPRRRAREKCVRRRCWGSTQCSTFARDVLMKSKESILKELVGTPSWRRSKGLFWIVATACAKAKAPGRGWQVLAIARGDWIMRWSYSEHPSCYSAAWQLAVPGPLHLPLPQCMARSEAKTKARKRDPGGGSKAH